MRRIATILTLSAALAMGLGDAAKAAPIADKELCKNEGFKNYIDPTTDLPFKNQGRCVSFVNGGGVLVPVEEEPPVAIAPTVEFVGFVWQREGQLYEASYVIQGQPNTTYELLQTYEGEFKYEGPLRVVTNAYGLATQNSGVPYATVMTISYDGQTLASIGELAS